MQSMTLERKPSKSFDPIVEDRVEKLKEELSVSYWKLVRKTALIEKERDKTESGTRVEAWMLEKKED